MHLRAKRKEVRSSILTFADRKKKRPFFLLSLSARGIYKLVSGENFE